MRCSNCDQAISDKTIGYSWPGAVTCPGCKVKYKFVGGRLFGFIYMLCLVIATIGVMFLSPYFDVVDSGIHKKTFFSYLFFFVLPWVIAIAGAIYFGKRMKRFVSCDPEMP